MADRSKPPDDVAVDELKRKARRRLVGAAVLALAAAVLVPLLLEKEPRPLGDEVSVQIPPVDEGRFVNKLTGPKAKDAPTSAKAGAARSEGGKAEPKADTKPDAAKPPAPVGDVDRTSPPADAGAAPEASSASAPRNAAGPGAPAVPAPKKALSDAEQRILAPTSRPAAAERVATAPVPDATPAASAPVPSAAVKTESAKPAPPKSEPVKSEPGKSEQAKSESSKPAAATSRTEPAKPEPAKAATPAGKPEGFVVQLAAYADDKGANSLANRLKKAGYAAYVEPVETTRGTLWRVRVGGYATREAATAARDKLKAEGQSGIVAPAR